MSKRSYIHRYQLIIKKLKGKQYCSFNELQRYVEVQFAYLQMQDEALNMGFSKRTLQRDIKEIYSLFGINIEYSTANKGYFITQSHITNNNYECVFEAFDLLSLHSLAQDIAPMIQLETRKPRGTEHLFGLLHAIKNRFQISFAYQPFWQATVSQRTVQPFALKEFKNRWYIIANDTFNDTIKTYALDRLMDLEISTTKFYLLDAFNIQDYYRYCFGIITPEDEEPEIIILSFNSLQGKYIKSLPLHQSQQILTDTETILVIQLELYITYDFVMEILSFGDNVKVIQPELLKYKIKAAHKTAYEQY